MSESEQTEVATVAPPSGSFADGFESMYLYIDTTRKKFKLDEFIASEGEKAERDWYVVSVAPRDPQIGEYHIICKFWYAGDKVHFRIEIRRGSVDHDEGEREPYAEDFIAWLGRFFRYGTVTAHSHTVFKYPIAEYQTRFPIPLQMDIGGDAELYGVMLRFKARPSGVSVLRVSQGKNKWLAEVVANSKIVFDSFSPHSETRALKVVLDTFMEAKMS